MVAVPDAAGDTDLCPLFEHIIAFAILGTLFGFAYPRRALLAAALCLVPRALLETAQTLTPDRHGTLWMRWKTLAAPPEFYLSGPTSTSGSSAKSARTDHLISLLRAG